MPDINMQVYKEVQRNQLVTEVDIQTQVALDDYQVQLAGIANPTQSQDNIVIDRFGEFLPHWNESLDFDSWVKLSMELAGKRLLILRGNPDVSSASNGSNTFIAYHGAATNIYLDSLLIDASLDFIFESRYKPVSGTSNAVYFGISNNQIPWTDDSAWIDDYVQNRMISYDDGDTGAQTTTTVLVQGTWYDFKMVKKISGISMYKDDEFISPEITTYIPNESCGLFFYEDGARQGEQEYSFIRKYTATEPTWAADGEEQNIAVALKSLGRAG